MGKTGLIAACIVMALAVPVAAENKPVLVPGAEAIWTTKIIDAIYESSRANKEIRLK